MRTPTICTVALAIFCCLVCLQEAKARIIIADSLRYDDFTGVVYGYASTVLTYPERYYYDAGVDSVLLDQSWNVRDQHYTLGGSSASVNTQTFGSPGMTFYLQSGHYLGFYYYYCDYECGYYDYYGYSLYGGEYPSYYEFEPYYACYAFYDVYDFADTYLQITVPQPECPPGLYVQLRSNRTSDVLNGTAQTALLGAKVQLQAVVSGASGGTYTWTVTGVAQQSVSGSTDTILWSDVGMKTVRVDFTPSGGGCQVSATVNINVVVPTLSNFSASIITNTAVDYCVLGPTDPGAFPWLMFGCIRDGRSGIRFTATVNSPQYISEDGTMQYLQIGYGGHTRTNANGSVDCYSTNGEWIRDSDPYTDSPPEEGPQDPNKAQKDTTSGGNTTIDTYDSPGQGLDGREDYTSDEQFEMYVIYTANGIKMPLSYIHWTWRGEAVKDTAYPGYRLVSPYPSLSDIPQTLTGSTTNTIRPYNNAKVFNELQFAPCGGVGCDPDGSRARACQRRGNMYEWDPDTCTCQYTGGL